jgi:hypothetical protein
MIFRVTFLFILSLSSLFAEEIPESAVTRLEDGSMKLGEINFDTKTKIIRVPCKLNMNDGLIEFAVVHETGKVHESLLTTKVSPTNINLACKLLNYTASEELYAIMKEPGIPSNKFPEVAEATRMAARTELQIEWIVDGKTNIAPLTNWIKNSSTAKSMENKPWVYGGSIISEGKFLAETSGNIVSIYLARGSLILFNGKDYTSDEVWFVKPDDLPALDSAVTLIIKPYTDNK